MRVNNDLAASLRDRALTLDDELVVGINQFHAVADFCESFTTADVRVRLAGDPNSRSVRRQLAALVEAGHLDRMETPNGVATQFSDSEALGAGQVELPSVGDAHPDEPTQCISDTWSVRVVGGETIPDPHRDPPSVTITPPRSKSDGGEWVKRTVIRSD